MSYQSHEYYLRRAIEISREARAVGNTPFGALLVNKDGDIVMEQGNMRSQTKSVQVMRKQLWPHVHPMNLQRIFSGTVPYIPQRNHAQCVPAPSTGPISAA